MGFVGRDLEDFILNSEYSVNAPCYIFSLLGSAGGGWGTAAPNYAVEDFFSLMILAGRNAATGKSGLESSSLVHGQR